MAHSRKWHKYDSVPFFLFVKPVTSEEEKDDEKDEEEEGEEVGEKEVLVSLSSPLLFVGESQKQNLRAYIR